ncbi:MAG: hypothetical protein U5Q16_14875 [Gammaproteobacteria bacterium]|nr:hypothetical protein [Gammaproteobacteria bacterium]
MDQDADSVWSVITSSSKDEVAENNEESDGGLPRGFRLYRKRRFRWDHDIPQGQEGNDPPGIQGG